MYFIVSPILTYRNSETCVSYIQRNANQTTRYEIVFLFFFPPFTSHTYTHTYIHTYIYSSFFPFFLLSFSTSSEKKKKKKPDRYLDITSTALSIHIYIPTV